MENRRQLNNILSLDEFESELSENFSIHSLNKNLLNSAIFTEEDLILLNKNEKKEPDWIYMFFDWMTDSMKKIYFQDITKLYSQPTLYFVKGLIIEYNYSQNSNEGCKKTCLTSNDFQKALDYYLLGAKFNNQYCLFKLFYILKDHKYAEKFGLIKNIDLSLFFLIKASSYNESFLDINKIDPIIKLMHIVYFNDRDLNRTRKLLERMKYVKNCFNIIIDDYEFKYLYYFLRLNFSNKDYEFKEALFNLEQISDKQPEAMYKLGCLYYNPIHKHLCPRDIEKSLKNFRILFKKNYIKSYCSFYKICEELKLYDEIEQIVKICKKQKCFSFQFYANYLSKDKDDLISISLKILKNFFNSLLYGNIISVVITFEIFTQIFLKNLKIIEQEKVKLYTRYLEIIHDFVSKKKKEKYLNDILDYDVVVLFHQIHAYFFYKGIFEQKNYHKAIEILEATFEDKKSYKNYRKVFYYLGKCYKKIGDDKKSNFYFKNAFDIYLMLKEFPYHHYVVARMFIEGIPGYVEPNLKNAIYFLQTGANYKENYYFINSLYSIKCSNYLKENKIISDYMLQYDTSNLLVNLDIYHDNERTCICCFSNFKQIIFVKCGHKCICYLCFEKLNNKSESKILEVKGSWKCPLCQQVSEYFINSFASDFSK
jgi:TPR repeat protein